MEVHAHPHTARKKWTHYLWEFLMLFLAVFCGFLAEYQLEHKIDKDKEREYIHSMIEDLEQDTANLSLVISRFQEKEIQLDSVFTLYSKLASGYNDTLRRNILTIQGYPDFIYADRTMQQLKSSGAMRLIRNKTASDGIIGYDSRVRDLVTIDIPDLNISFHKIGELWQELFDEENLTADKKLRSIAEIEKGSKNYLLKQDKASLGKFYNSLRDMQDIFSDVRAKETELKASAVQLGLLLKKEYHLK